MKICSNCGNKIFENEKKCSVCKTSSKNAIPVDENDKERIDEIVASVRASKSNTKPKKKSKLMPIIIVVVLLAIIGSMFGGDDDTPNDEQSKTVLSQNKEPAKTAEPVEAEKLYEVGESFDTGKLGVEVLEVEERTEFKSDNQFIDSVTTEGKFIAVKAKLTNNDTEARTFSSSMFKIIDEQDRTFETLTDANLMMILDDDNLFFESCNPGMSRTGIFVFEVPDGVESYYLEVLSGTGFAAKTSAKVKLK